MTHQNTLPSALGLAIALVLGLSPLLRAAEQSALAPPRSPAGREAAYTQTLEKRVVDILAALELNDSAKSVKVHDLLIAQYRALRDWHDANDLKLKGATPEATAQIKSSLEKIHARFLAALGTELSPGQVDKVKDKMTYGKMKVTYDAYCEIVPNLTEAQREKILALLKEAREEAMDGGSSEEKSAIFKKYKGKINNYLSKEGHNVGQAYKDWGAKQKTNTTTQVRKSAK